MEFIEAMTWVLVAVIFIVVIIYYASTRFFGG